MQPPEISVVDPFDLPEWLGTEEVTWTPEEGVRTGHLVAGALSATGHETLPCDLLAVDEAYPAPVVADAPRAQAHQAWQHGQVMLGRRDGRLVLAVPGTRFGPDLVLRTLARLARAVGGSPDRYAAYLRIGAEAPRRPSPGR
ncbi:hypothetical protein [Nocardioides campestrisoli]|uniref:hypothetical protein n=1 Tax=Nocardioides campestrisoli TaxID=2736757 RepID=UPI0015E62FF1|nr:hypothetical protein [Nocardioides campestrisoli]